MLTVPPVDETAEFLPSPEELKFKVLIKNHKLPDHHGRPSESSVSSQLLPDEDDESPGGIYEDIGDIQEALETARAAEERRQSVFYDSLANSEAGSVAEQSEDSFKPDNAFKAATGTGDAPASASGGGGHGKKVHPDLSALVQYTVPIKFVSFPHSLTERACYHMSSFGEPKATKLAKKEGEDWVRYNKRQLSRIYPAGWRVDSSNYSPAPFWNCGCQMVC